MRYDLGDWPPHIQPIEPAQGSTNWTHQPARHHRSPATTREETRRAPDWLNARQLELSASPSRNLPFLPPRR